MVAGLPPSYAIEVGGLPLTMEGAPLWSLHMPVPQLRVVSSWSLCSSQKPNVGRRGV
jgi:hypothetical protein